MIIVITDVDEVAALLGLSTERHPTIIRPQTSGPCVHFDPDGVFSPDGDGEQGEHQDSAPACAYPSERGALCPHLDNPEILCPVKDACSAMSGVARMRDACEAEQEEQDADMAAQDEVYETETPEFVEPTPEEEPVYEAPPLAEGEHLDPRRWTPEQERAMCGATTPAEAVALYRAAYPGSSRTDAAIKSRYHQKIRPQRGATPSPDFAGDTAPVTQYDEPRSIGAPSYPRTGARAQIRYPPEFADRTGTVVQYDPDSPEMLVALDNSLDRIWLSPESLVLIGAGRGSP